MLADREFIGADWMDFPSKNNVPFATRRRETMNIRIKGRTYSFASLLRRHRRV